MKKLSLFFLGFVTVFVLVACSNSKSNSQSSVTSTSQTQESSQVSSSLNASQKILIAYFSVSGNTATIAQEIASETGGDLFEIKPQNPYSEDDLNWTVESSRVVQKYLNESQRDTPLETTSVNNWEEYDTVFIGYPIWWREAAWPINDFIQENDFSGKTVIPFATSTSSDFGESGNLLAEMAGTGNWQEG